MVAPLLLDQNKGPGRVFVRRSDRPGRRREYQQALAAAEAAGDQDEIREQQRLLRINASLPHRMHGAWDIFAPEGTPVHALLPGIVIDMGTRSGYGHQVILVHPNPPATAAAGNRRPPEPGGEPDRSSDPVTVAYSHLQRRADGLAVGQEVAEGEVVAYVGRTNRNASGSSGAVGNIAPHLHMGVSRVSIHPDRLHEHSFRDRGGLFEHYAPSGHRTRRATGDICRQTDEGLWVPMRRVRFSSSFEEDWRRYIQPDDWLRELHGVGPDAPINAYLGERVE